MGDRWHCSCLGLLSAEAQGQHTGGRQRVLCRSSTAGRGEQWSQEWGCPARAGGQAARCWWAAAEPGSCCETLRSFPPSRRSSRRSPGSSRRGAARPAPTPAGPTAGGGCSPGGCQTPGSLVPGTGLKTRTEGRAGFDVPRVNLNVGGQLRLCDFSYGVLKSQTAKLVKAPG